MHESPCDHMTDSRIFYGIQLLVVTMFDIAEHGCLKNKSSAVGLVAVTRACLAFSISPHQQNRCYRQTVFQITGGKDSHLRS